MNHTGPRGGYHDIVVDKKVFAYKGRTIYRKLNMAGTKQRGSLSVIQRIVI